MSTSPTPMPAMNPPAKKSGSLLPWLLGLIGVGIFVLCLLAILTVQYILREGRIRRAGRSLEISTPLGGFKVDKGADTGLPIYPGSRVEKEGTSVELTAPTDDTLEITAAHYLSHDSLDAVDSWYRHTLGNDFEREGPGGKHVKVHSIPYLQVESAETAYVSDRKDTVRLVVLKDRLDGIEIKLVRIAPREVQ
jgi:hypothetical protein